jgi:hypothetical protein
VAVASVGSRSRAAGVACETTLDHLDAARKGPLPAGNAGRAVARGPYRQRATLALNPIIGFKVEI